MKLDRGGCIDQRRKAHDASLMASLMTDAPWIDVNLRPQLSSFYHISISCEHS
jgi:hypothetical protein